MESGCWVQARNWEGSLMRVVGPPEPLQFPVPCSCDPSLGSEFLLRSIRPFLSGHWARESIERALSLIALS